MFITFELSTVNDSPEGVNFLIQELRKEIHKKRPKDSILLYRSFNGFENKNSWDEEIIIRKQDNKVFARTRVAFLLCDSICEHKE